MRFPLRPFLNVVIAGGLVLTLWPLGQTVYGVWNQRSLAAQFKTQIKNSPVAKIGKANAKAFAKINPALAVSAPPRAQRASWPLTKLSIPDIGLETFIVQGMDAAALKRGPGHDANSSPPGQGNCVVAGHRNVYGSFFYRLDELLPGAPIVVENREGKWNYIVDAVFTTSDTDLTVLKPPVSGAAPLLTLITCTMPHTSNRIILQARLSAQ